MSPQLMRILADKSHEDQLTINKKGEIIAKKCMIYDLSYKRKLGLSVNQQVFGDKMPEVIVGFALLHFFHLIHHIRWSFPILYNKIDVKKA